MDESDYDFMRSRGHEALFKFGHDVSFEMARSQIGKGGDKLIPFFLSEAEQADHGQALENWREKRFKEKYLPLVRSFSAVPDLLTRVRAAGLKVAVASSAKKDQLDQYLEIAGPRNGPGRGYDTLCSRIRRWTQGH